MSYSEHLDYYVEAIGNMVTLAELQLAGPVAYEVKQGQSKREGKGQYRRGRCLRR
jgi:hypothetical protein